MTLRPEYMLGRSEYNAFLFASVGEQKNGLELTLLSAFTRLGIDPWQEAARLSDMPRDGAIQALAATIARLPDGAALDSAAVAARLVQWLPGRSVPAIPLVDNGADAGGTGWPGGRAAQGGMQKPALLVWLAWGGVIGALLILFGYL